MENNKYFKEGVYGLPYIPYLTGEDAIKQCAYFINRSNNIVVLTGAGMSTDSGIPDFRSKTGLYSKTPEYTLSLYNFNKNPKEVYDFLYKYLNTINVKPNRGHLAIKEIEDMGKEVNVITMNIDHLHSINKNVIEFHGSLDKAKCLKCGKIYNIDEVIKRNDDEVKYDYNCDCGGLIKPNIVLYGEDVYDYVKAKEIASKADLLIVLGTSMVVNPFASLPNECSSEIPIIIINETPTYLDNDRMAIVIHDNISNTLDKIINHIKDKTF